MKKYIYLTILILLITNCSPTTSSWSCKGSIKGSCKTIHEIDNGYEKGKVNKIEKELKENIKSRRQESQEMSSFDDFRSRESVARVVFTPYVDTAGNRHDVSTVYYLEQKAEWKK